MASRVQVSLAADNWLHASDVVSTPAIWGNSLSEIVFIIISRASVSSDSHFWISFFSAAVGFSGSAGCGGSFLVIYLVYPNFLNCWLICLFHSHPFPSWGFSISSNSTTIYFFLSQ